jgi:hypothetical protein
MDTEERFSSADLAGSQRHRCLTGACRPPAGPGGLLVRRPQQSEIARESTARSLAQVVHPTYLPEYAMGSESQTTTEVDTRSLAMLAATGGASLAFPKCVP